MPKNMSIVNGVVIDDHGAEAALDGHRSEGVIMGTVVSAPSTPPARVEEEDEVKRKDEVIFVHHAVEFDDSISTLAIRYGSTIDGIMKANGLLTRDLDLLPKGCVLRIPRTHEKPLGDVQVLSNDAQSRQMLEERHRLQRRVIRDFSITHSCSTDEAAFYLEDHDFNVEDATKARSDDVRWEQSAGGREAKKQFKKKNLLKSQ